MCLRADEGDEEHETDNLEEGLCWLGEGEEFYDDAVPEEFADEGEDDEADDERKDHCETVCIDFLLLCWGGVSETFYCYTCCADDWVRVHFLYECLEYFLRITRKGMSGNTFYSAY